MTADPSTTTSGTGRILGLGALACIACCVGPFLGLLSAIGIAATAGTLIFGLTGLAAALLAIPVLWRRRRAPTCAPLLDHEVAVAVPTIRHHD